MLWPKRRLSDEFLYYKNRIREIKPRTTPVLPHSRKSIVKKLFLSSSSLIKMDLFTYHETPQARMSIRLDFRSMPDKKNRYTFTNTPINNCIMIFIYIIFWRVNAADLDVHILHCSCMDLLKTIGHNVKKYRRQRHWSQEALAYESNLHRTSIGEIERGTRNCSVLIIKQLADALKVEPHKLLIKE